MLALALLLAMATASPAAPVAAIEAHYANLLDAFGAVTTIDSGLVSTFHGKDRAAWLAVYSAERAQVAQGLEQLQAAKSKLAPEDARAVLLMRQHLESAMPADIAHAAFPGRASAHCADASRPEADLATLHSSLYACFDEFGNHLQFEGATITRVGALGRLATLDTSARRRALFLAFVPLWRAINGGNEPNSPYRRLIALTAASHTDRIADAARTVGVPPAEVEHWLEQILDAWRRATPDEADGIEPWDYHYAAGAAERLLASAIPLADFPRINERYYRELGADLNRLGVLYDLQPRPGKAPLAYSSFVTAPRLVKGRWIPALARVSASYETGGLGSLNELVHENGHAVHIAAIRARPAFSDLGDDLFLEAFADVTSWDTFDPAWQRKYLGRSAPLAENLCSQYSGVMLDVAWSLFELRMLKNPAADPNQLWTAITSRYLHIKPHPELSWWALRVQLVDVPGYMVNYGLGAVITADIRQHTREAIGPTATGNPRWYPWISTHLLRGGQTQESSDLLQHFLGRPVSPDALLKDVGRMSAK